jgi:hypothetical protein
VAWCARCKRSHANADSDGCSDVNRHRDPNAQSDGDSQPDADGYAIGDSNGNGDRDRDRRVDYHGNAHRITNCDGDAHCGHLSHGHRHRCGYGYTASDRHVHTSPNSDCSSDANSYRDDGVHAYPNGDRDTYSDSVTDTDLHPDSGADGDTHADCNADADTNADGDGDTHANANRTAGCCRATPCYASGGC